MSTPTLTDKTALQEFAWQRQAVNIAVKLSDEDDKPELLFVGDYSSNALAVWQDLSIIAETDASIKLYKAVPFNCMLTYLNDDVEEEETNITADELNNDDDSVSDEKLVTFSLTV